MISIQIGEKRGGGGEGGGEKRVAVVIVQPISTHLCVQTISQALSKLTLYIMLSSHE